MTILNIFKKLDSKPWDLESWKSLFNYLDKSPKDARTHREKVVEYLGKYTEKFPTSPDFWLRWFAFERACLEFRDANMEVDFGAVQEVYRSGLRECPSWKVALAYVEDQGQYTRYTDSIDHDNVIGEALHYCGMDVTSGGLLWQMRLENALDIALECTPEPELLGYGDAVKEVEKVVDVLRDLVSHPLVTIETALESMDEVFGVYFKENSKAVDAADDLQLSSLNEIAEKSIHERHALTDFESKVAFFETPIEDGQEGKCSTVEQLAEMVTLWHSYAKHEADRGCTKRAERIYERALLSLQEQPLASSNWGVATPEARPVVTSLWVSYIKYIVYTVGTPRNELRQGQEDKEEKEKATASHRKFAHVIGRALKACHYSKEIWEFYFLSLERNPEISIHDQLDQLFNAYTSALGAELGTNEDYIFVLKAFPETRDRILRVQKRKYSNWEDLDNNRCGHGSIENAHVQSIKNKFSSVNESAEEITEEWLNTYYPTWDEPWVQWALTWAAHGRTYVLKNVLKRFPTTRYMGSMCHLLAQQGEIQSCREALDFAIQEQSLLLQSAESTLETGQLLGEFLSLYELLYGKYGNSDDYMHCLQVTNRVKDRFERQLAGQVAVLPSKRKREDRDDMTIVGGKGDNPDSVKTSSTKNKKKMKVERAAEGSNTLRVKNLPFDATESDIEGLVGSRVQVQVQTRLAMAYSGRSKGIAYVTFPTPDSCTSFMQENKETDEAVQLNGRILEFEQLSNLQLEQVNVEHNAPQPLTVFVSGVPVAWEVSHVLTLFAHCGDIVEAKLLEDSTTKYSSRNSSRSSSSDEKKAIVQFLTVKGREKAFSLHKQVVTVSDLHKSTLGITICKEPLVVNSGTSSLPIARAQSNKDMEIPYVPPPIVELKVKPKRAGIMFKPKALR